MDGLAETGFVVYGGPADGGESFVFAVDAHDADEIATRLAADPWGPEMLELTAVHPWSVWLGSDPRVRDAKAQPLALVTERAGSRWDHDRPRREQAGWDAHAAFMDALADDGVVAAGGPISPTRAVLVMRVSGETAVRRALADDPWFDGTLELERVQPWELWLMSARVDDRGP
jgi:hypothetical protein